MSARCELGLTIALVKPIIRAPRRECHKCGIRTTRQCLSVRLARNASQNECANDQQKSGKEDAIRQSSANRPVRFGPESAENR